MDRELIRVVAGLLREIHEAHAEAFAATNGEDPDWDRWYADRLAAPLGSLLGRAVGAADLAATLRTLDERHRSGSPEEPWPEFYAAFLVQAP